LAFLASFLATYGGEKEMNSGVTRIPAKDFVLCTPFNYGIDHSFNVNLVTLKEN